MKKIIKLLNEDINIFIEENNKPLLVFLHAFNTTYRSANEIIKIKNRTFDIATFDFPGCGKSSNNSLISIAHYIEIANSFLDSLKRENVIVLGHSIGGAIAAGIANHQKVRKVILLSTINPFIIANHTKELLEKKLFPTNLAEAKDSYLSLIYNKEKVIYFKHVELSSKILLRFTNNTRARFQYILRNEILSESYLEKNLTNLFFQIKKPIIAIYGNKDNVCLPVGQQKLYQAIQAKIYQIKNCGHVPIYEYPLEVLKIITTQF